MKERSAGVIVYRRNSRREYLLLHYPAGHWDLPKGHVEKRETEKKAAVRETKEETGITQLHFQEPFRERLSYVYTRNRSSIFKEVAFFLAETEEEKVKLSSEHKGYAWLPYDEAAKRITFGNTRKILEKAEQFLRQQAKEK